MRYFFNCLLWVVMLVGWPKIVSSASLETRYGKLETRTEDDAVLLLWEGRQIASVKGLDMELYRVDSNGPNEIIIVDTLLPGLHCLHEYAMLEITAGAVASLSKPFGTCTNLDAVKSTKDTLVIQLRETYVDGGRKQRIKRYKWKKGLLVQQK
ncbi:MAG: hypothetical protein V4632_22370 [Pseudomonadota bacterium]